MAVVRFCLLCVFNLQLSQALIGDEFCIRTKPQFSAIPRIPQFYSTRVQANIEEHNLTIEARIVYDGSGGPSQERALMVIQQREGTSYSLFLAQQEIRWNDTGSDCHVVPINSSLEAIYSNFLIRGDWLLHNLHYNGTTDVRGIPTDRWRTCFYMDEIRSMIDMDMFFLVSPSWETVDPNLDAVPVRLKIRRRQYEDGSNNQWSDLTQTYDYFDFTSAASELTHDVFQVSEGILCEGTKNNIMFPVMGKKFSYQSERIHMDRAIFTFLSVWYDADSKMMKTSGKFSDTDTHETVIYDFNTGIRYTIEMYDWGCLPSFIKPDDKMVNRRGNSSFSMIGVNEFLGVEDDLSTVFVGKRKVRDVWSEIWIGRVGSNMTREWYFLSSPWVTSPGVVYQVGTLIMIKTYKLMPQTKPKLVEVVNIIGFNFSPENWKEFEDISHCYPPGTEIRFVITLDVGLQNMDLVIAENAAINIKKLVAKRLGIEPLRIVKAEFEYDGFQHCFFYAILLDAARVNGRLNETYNTNSSTTVYTNLAKTVHDGSLKFVEQEILMEATFVERINFKPEQIPTTYRTPPIPTKSPTTTTGSSSKAPTLSTERQSSMKIPPTLFTKQQPSSSVVTTKTRILTETPPTFHVPTPTTRLTSEVTSCSCQAGSTLSSESTTKVEETSSYVSGYSAGAMAGLGFAMLGLGIGLTLIVTKIYLSRRPADSATITLVEM